MKINFCMLKLIRELLFQLLLQLIIEKAIEIVRIIQVLLLFLINNFEDCDNSNPYVIITVRNEYNITRSGHYGLWINGSLEDRLSSVIDLTYYVSG